MTKTRTVTGAVSESEFEEGSASNHHIKDAESSLQTHLHGVNSGINQLLRQIKALRSENKSLKQKLKRAEEQILCITPSKADKAESRAAALSTQVAELKSQLDELRNENKKQKKKIQKMRQKELEAEAEDLRTNKLKEGGEIDPEYRMRKLLRNFSDYMLMNTIADDSSETCVVCFEPFVKKKCSSLSCEHIICHDCLPGISKGADETIQCPQCRGVTDRDDLELIHMTEGERWDELLKIANAWCAWDHRGNMETSEEESEENFIDDGEETSEASQSAPASVAASQSGKTSDDEPQDKENGDEAAEDSDVSIPITPRRLRSRPKTYLESPVQDKRKRLAELADERERAYKRRR